MHLQILLPTDVLLDTQAAKVVAEAENGSFCLLPRHVNFVTSLAPGILTFTDAQGEDHLVGVADGVLVKTGNDVLVSVEYGVKGVDLGHLRDTVRHYFETVNERERQAVSAVARLEADFVRRFLALKERPYGG
ncbi:MAG: F0F1 ATP synthase subunit epsilon [Planctomycetota bacterium]|nr:F0F1 ATP synthase subunit epsilon [Planctomycetota bacterium]